MKKFIVIISTLIILYFIFDLCFYRLGFFINFNYNDIKTLDYFIDSSDVDESIKNDLRRKKDSIVDYCLSNKCRHQLLCRYFNEKIDRCGNKCDNCKK